MSEQTASSALEATARWTAAVRALEHARPDGLFSDPWAEALAGAEGMAWAARRPPQSILPILVRIRFFDDALAAALAAGIRQVVILAAGLDTRAFRLHWPERARVFELDRQPVLDHKAAVLGAACAAAVCERIPIAADLGADWPPLLAAAGFAADQPSAWLLEGFLFYLPDAAIERMLSAVSALAAPGSWIGFDIVNGATYNAPWTRPWLEMQAAAGAPWLGKVDDPAAALAERGWGEVRITQPGARDANYGRWTLPVIPVAAPDMPHHWLVTATR